MTSENYKTISNRIRSFIRPPYYGYDIEDLIQDTILKLIEKKYDYDNSLRLCKIFAYNLFVDHYRKNKKFKQIYDKSPERLCYQFCNLDFKIPDKYKELYILRYKFKMKYEEIKDFLNMPLGTVKNHISRMKKEIKKLNDL